jgi:hypothetical protein
LPSLDITIVTNEKDDSTMGCSNPDPEAPEREAFGCELPADDRMKNLPENLR